MAGFTNRELQVIELRASGLTVRQIAVRLGCKPKTVHGHITSVYRKAGLENVAQLARWAIEFGLDEPDDELYEEDWSFPRTKPSPSDFSDDGLV